MAPLALARRIAHAYRGRTAAGVAAAGAALAASRRRDPGLRRPAARGGRDGARRAAGFGDRWRGLLPGRPGLAAGPPAPGAPPRGRACTGRTRRALLRRGDLVLAPWEHDGHPDHDAVGRAALAATAALPGLRLLRYPVWAWHWLPPDASPPPFAAIRMPLPPATLARKRRAI